jgi:hypothetical protein
MILVRDQAISAGNQKKGVINMAFRKKVSFLGFIIGGIVDIVGSNVWGIVATLYVVFAYKLFTLAPGEITKNVMVIFKTDPLVFSANLIVGGFFSIFGGYIGALIAKHDELLNGALSAYFCVGLGLYGIFTGSYSGPVVLAFLSLLIDPLLAMFGGYLRLKQRSRRRLVLSSANNPSV